MTSLLLITFAAFLLEDNQLLASAGIIQNCSFHYGPVYVWSTYFDSAVCIYKQNLVEHKRSALFLRETVNKNLHASFHFELLASNLNYCVHK